MSGRGDNNKSGSSGRGASNQSSQGFGQAADREKSNHGEQTGGKASIPKKKTQDQDSNRNDGSKNERK
ncbi:MAG: hypothetical protein ACXWV9_01520 [Flavisolibacter sp.]